MLIQKVSKVTKLSIGILLIVPFLLMQCKSDKSAKTNEVTLDDFIEDEVIEEISNVKKIFYSLPSPLETAMLLKSAGAEYNDQLLNSIDNAENYTTNKKMALNLGIYITDMSYASLFDQTQASIDYMTASKKMADGLNIADVINESTFQQLEASLNNRDSIMRIISETYLNANASLKDEDKRPEIAAMMLTGGWIEGLYIATTLAKGKPILNNKMVERIIDQKLSFEILQKLLDVYKDHEDISNLNAQLNPIKEAYNKVTIKSTEITTETDTGTNVTLLKSQTETDISQETLDQLTQVVKSIRNDFIL